MRGDEGLSSDWEVRPEPPENVKRIVSVKVERKGVRDLRSVW